MGRPEVDALLRGSCNYYFFFNSISIISLGIIYLL